MSYAPIRLDRLRSVCACLGMQAMCVRDTSNITWLTAFDEVFDEECAHALLVDVSESGRVVLHTDSRYVTACERAAKNTPIDISAERISHAEFSVRFLNEVSLDTSDKASSDKERNKYLGIEDSITLAQYREFERAITQEEANSLHLRETNNLVIELRAVKDVDEIARLRVAQAITDAAFSYIVGFIRPGMSEREVQLELEHYMRAHGASGVAFSSIVAAGANGASPHAIAGDTCLEAGQCVVLDFGARACGYCSDITRTVFLGEPDAAMCAAWETMRRANEEVEAYIRPGVTGKQAHELAERVLDEGGFGGKMGHGLGHGVGIDVHEQPVLNLRNDAELVPGNVVTVEPGIYIPGEFGMRFEDLGVVTSDGFDVFTQSTHNMVVI